LTAILYITSENMPHMAHAHIGYCGFTGTRLNIHCPTCRLVMRHLSQQALRLCPRACQDPSSSVMLVCYDLETQVMSHDLKAVFYLVVLSAMGYGKCAYADRRRWSADCKVLYRTRYNHWHSSLSQYSTSNNQTLKQ
jgi:hypothetical protein